MARAIVTASGDNVFNVVGERLSAITPHSSSVQYWSYDPEQNELAIQYKSSKAFYVYKSVPFSTLFGLMTAESVGSFVAKEVKPNFEFEKVGE